MTAFGLFEALDTVNKDRRDPRDDEWQLDAWQCLVQRQWTIDAERTRTHSPFLSKLCPGGTGMVQIVRDVADRHRVVRYLTKELSSSSLELAYLNSHWAERADFLARELRDFHSDQGAKRPASRIRTDPDDGSQSLDLDDLQPWKWRGKRLKH
jgi:hypothetical protein